MWEDDSIELHSSSTPHRELENLLNTVRELLEEGVEPQDILVFAPDITVYEPYIAAVFATLPYQINDMPERRYNEKLEAFFLLLDLENKRWSAPHLLELLSRLGQKEIDQIRRWIEQTGIRWGLDGPHRAALLEKRGCVEASGEGVATWQEGIDQLLDELACGGRIEFVQAELLGELILRLEKLRQMHTLFQKSCTLDQWAERFEEICPDEGALKQLARASAWALGRLYSFEQARTLIEQLIEGQRETIHPHAVQAIRFSSMLPMRAIPAKAICLIGMNEEAFPRKEQSASFDLLRESSGLDYFPSRLDFDRYLFLEAAVSAKQKLVISWLDDSLPSSVVSQILPYVGSKQREHPAKSYDRRYFAKEGQSFSKSDFVLAKRFYHEPKRGRPALFDKVPEPLELPSGEQIILLEDLKRAARSSLAHYLKGHELAIREKLAVQDEEDFVLPAWRRAALRKQGVFAEAKMEGHFPPGLFGKLASLQLQEQVEALKAHFDPNRCETLEIRGESVRISQDLSVRLFGTIDSVRGDGLLLLEEPSFRAMLKAWPQLLMLHALDPNKTSLYFAKTGEKRTFAIQPKHLQSFFKAYFLAQNVPCPFFPDWIEPILQKRPDRLQKIVGGNLYDASLKWASRSSAPIDCVELIERWHPLVSELYQEVFDAF